LKKRNHRLHQIDALMRVLLDIDKAVALIRGSANPDAARTALMKHFKLDEEQADYVMNMQLRRLTKFDRLELENEKDKLTKEVVELNTILADRAVLISTIDNELKEVAKVLDVERKSEVLGLDLDQHIKESKAAAKVVSVEIADEPCFISLSHKGSIIRSAKAPRNTKSTAATTTRGRFTAITNRGNAFRIDALHVGEKAASAASVLPSTLPKGEKVICLAPVALEDGKVGGLAMGTALGVVKVQDPKGFPKTQDEFSVISLADGDEIIGMRWVPDNTKAIFSFVSEDTSVLAFKGEACRPQGATSGGGIAGFKLAEGCKAMVFSVVMDDEMDDAVVITHSGDTGKMSKFNLFSLKGRATGGMRSQRMTRSDQSEKLAYAFVGTNPTLVNAEGNAIELPALDPRRDGSGKPFEGGVPVMV
jgi:DNA gyrase subunit A